eukprot:4945823-Pyramimonas_sp.AAC.1
MGDYIVDIFCETEVRKDFVKVDVGLLRAQDVQKPYKEGGLGKHSRREGGDGLWKCFFEDNGVCCPAAFESSRALSTHIQRVHHRTDVYASIVVTNQCPYCAEIFSSHQAAYRHVIAKRAYPDRVSRCRYLGAVIEPKSLDCPLCEYSAQTLADLHRHIVEHAPAHTHAARGSEVGSQTKCRLAGRSRQKEAAHADRERGGRRRFQAGGAGANDESARRPRPHSSRGAARLDCGGLFHLPHPVRRKHRGRHEEGGPRLSCPGQAAEDRRRRRPRYPRATVPARLQGAAAGGARGDGSHWPASRDDRRVLGQQ